MKKQFSRLALIALLLANVSCSNDSEELQIEKNFMKRKALNEELVQTKDSINMSYHYKDEEEPCNPKPRR
jgi:hypothetical protein